MSKISKAQHAGEQRISHHNLRSRVGTAFVASCLALSVCPAIAFAAPGTQGAPQDGAMNGNPPAAMQFDGENGGMPLQGESPDGQPGHDSEMPGAPSGNMQQGQMPDMPDNQGQAPDNQAETPSNMPQNQLSPNGQPDQRPSGNQPQPDGFDQQVRQILSETFGVALPDFGNGSEPSFKPGDPADAPELPEGAVNVQQVIDTMRDVLHEYNGEDLAAKIGDEDFTAALKAFAISATEQRLAMFANNERPNMENPSDLPSPEAAAPADFDAVGSNASAAAAPDTAIDNSLMSTIIGLIMDAFGYIAG